MQNLNVFEKTLQKSNDILKGIEEHFVWTDRHMSYLAFRAVMHTLRDRLSVESAASLAAQLPLVLKGVFFDGWKPAGKPIKMNVAEFVDEIRLRLNPPYGVDLGMIPTFEQSVEEITRGVLHVVEQHTDHAEIQKVKKTLPKDIVVMLEEKAE